jgi:hypothetical protein
VCSDLTSQLTDNFLSKIITGDETWWFQYGTESKRQRLQWKQPTSPRPKKAHISKSQMKAVVINFFDIRV